ncbi:ATP-binding protein [Janthinobacterium sp. 17J80-10]|uniref:ATP-binding protein n=1 Tax=Janthinobacterium sp. 17J80-10 TaxID=2497863 RepID=UPI00100574A6|nr:ATP-binding protein [Janthinobacterium sp. 17J80-10]QAU32710.1 GHKL domain-containing protein [Janthinobacterium sp. 17J80-10]
MPELHSLRYFWWVTGCIGAYVALDILCGPPMRYQPINPILHPAAGLAVFVLLRSGWRGLLPLAAAATLSSWVVPVLPDTPAWSLFIGVLPLPGYFAIALFMRRHLEHGIFLASHKGLLLWLAAATPASIFSGMLYASVVLGTGAIGADAWTDTLIRYGVAEIAGMVTFMSIAYCLADYESRFNLMAKVVNWETAGYMALMVLILWTSMNQPPRESMAYYLLFFPLAWAAARQGMAGAVAATAALEVCVMAATYLPNAYAAKVPDVQVLVLTLTLSGFLIGIAVDVAQRASNELRQSLRLAAAGEMAGALAHELNQPLTALAAYGSACAKLIERDGGNPLLQKAVNAMVAESDRASNVLKRLRDFFRTGSTRLEVLQLAELIDAATPPFQEQARSEKIEFVICNVPAATLLGDRIQLEIVLRNLLANAFQAVTQQVENQARKVTVEAGTDGPWIWIRIADNGPGIANKIRARLFEPFISLKSSGMGLGLAISRSIIETHGGTLSIEPSPHGVLKITLPANLTGLDYSDEQQQ